MKLLFAGTPANAARTLEWLLNSGHEVVAVLTRPDAPVGRKRVLTPSAVAAVAENAGLPVIKTSSVTPEVAQALSNTGAQLGVVVAYGALLKPFALQALPLGWINLHYSLLPAWRGAAPVQRAILAGERETGVTVFQLDAGMDTGPVYTSVPTEIQPSENSQRLLERLTDLGLTALSEVLPQLESGLARAIPQSEAGASYAAKLTRAEALIDWKLPAKKLERAVLAYNPEPVAYTMFDANPFRILDAVALPGQEFDTEPGRLILDPKRVLVVCGEGTLLQLRRVQPAGKSEMAAADWARGLSGKNLILGDANA